MASPPPRSATSWPTRSLASGQIDQRARSLCLESLRMAHAVGDARRMANALRVAAAIEMRRR